MILPTSLKGTVIRCMEAALKGQRVRVEMENYKVQTILQETYRVRKELNAEQRVIVRNFDGTVVLDPVMVTDPEQGVPTLSKDDTPVVFRAVNQIVTSREPSMELLAAYRLLLNEKIVMAVEITGMSEAQFKEKFPGVNAFITSDTKKGVLLL